MLDTLREWLVGWADSPAGPGVLAVIAAAESLFFPLPPDPLLIALALRHPPQALLLAGLTTAASVLGGVVGHWLGRRYGRPILQRFDGGRIDRVEALFRRYGFWAIVVAGLTPIPYKVFTISAGAFDVPRTQFVLASIVGRGGRFMVLGGLIFIWGERVQAFLDDHFDVAMVAAGAALALAAASWWLLRRRGPAISPAAVEAPEASRPHDAS